MGNTPGWFFIHSVTNRPSRSHSRSGNWVRWWKMDPGTEHTRAPCLSPEVRSQPRLFCCPGFLSVRWEGCFFVVDVLGLLLQKSEYKTKWHTETAASCSEHLLYKKSWPSARCYVTRRWIRGMMTNTQCRGRRSGYKPPLSLSLSHSLRLFPPHNVSSCLILFFLRLPWLLCFIFSVSSVIRRQHALSSFLDSIYRVYSELVWPCKISVHLNRRPFHYCPLTRLIQDLKKKSIYLQPLNQIILFVSVISSAVWSKRCQGGFY